MTNLKPVDVEQPAQPRPSPHAARHVGRRRAGNESIVEPLVIPFTMVMLDKLREGAPKVVLTYRNDAVETFFLDRRHEAFRVGIRIRRAYRNQHDPDAGLTKLTAHVATPFPIAIADQHSQPVVRQNVVIAEPVLLSAATPDRIRTCLN